MINTREESVVFYEVPKCNLKDKGYKQTSLMYLRSVSFVDEKDQKRKINLKEISGRKVSKEIKDINKDNWNSSLNVLYKRGVLVKSDDDDDLVIINETKNFVPLKNGFMKQMLKEYSSDYINCYLALWKRWDAYKRGSRDLPSFTLGDLIKEALNSENRGGAYYKRVSNAVAQLISDGLLVMNIKPVIPEDGGEPQTFIRIIVDLREQFVSRENCQKIEQAIIGNLKEANSAEDISINDIKEESLGQIGVKYIIKEITTDYVLYEENGIEHKKDFSLYGDNPRFYPEGMLNDIEEQGWFILPSGSARQI